MFWLMSFLLLSYHGISLDFRRENFVLCLETLEEEHTREYVNLFNEMLEK